MLPQQSSGVLFRDTVEVSAIPDPKVRGVTMFMSSVKDGRWKMKYMCATPVPLTDPTTAPRLLSSHALGPRGKTENANDAWRVV